MQIRTSELTGAALDWAVAQCEIPNDIRDNRRRFWVHPNNPKLICRETYNHAQNPKGYELYNPSTNWAQGGPIVEREGITLKAFPDVSDWWAKDKRQIYSEGETPLIAAMRCYVASKLGETVDIPEELLK